MIVYTSFESAFGAFGEKNNVTVATDADNGVFATSLCGKAQAKKNLQRKLKRIGWPPAKD